MILNIIIFKNVEIDAFTQPQFIDVVPSKAAIQLIRSIKLADDPSKIRQYKHLKMYELGSFDDETGEIKTFDPVLLADLVPIVKERLDVLEPKEDIPNV